MSQKFELRNIESGDRFLCERMIIPDANDKQIEYYVDNFIDCNEIVIYNGKQYQTIYSNTVPQGKILLSGFGFVMKSSCKRIIATNNDKSLLPKVVIESEARAEQFVRDRLKKSSQACGILVGFIEGFNEHAKTRPNSDEDMEDFVFWIGENQYTKHQQNDRWYDNGDDYIGTTEEIRLLWKSQRPEVIYIKP